MAKQRDSVIDRMRGIGIVLMVLGHSGFAGSDFIYLFHMALFFMLSGYVYNPQTAQTPAGIRRFCLRRVRTLWLPFVVTNTVYTVLQNLFLRLHILTNDPRILQTTGGTVTEPVTLKDVVGRTLHWCVFDGGTQLGGALWFVQALFQISIVYVVIDFLLHRFLSGHAAFAAQGFVSAALLFIGNACRQTGHNPWGLGIVCSGYCLFYLGAALRRLGRPALRPWQQAVLGAAAFGALAVLGRFGSVGLSGNQYPHWVLLLADSLLGWLLMSECAQLAGLLPAVGNALAALGRATMPIVEMHFLAFKPVTLAGLLLTGQELYLLAAFPIYFTGGAWWLAYTAAGLALPLALHGLVKRLPARKAR